MNPSNLNRGSAGFTVESDSMLYEKKQPPHPSFFHGGDNPMSSDKFSYQNQRFPSLVRGFNKILIVFQLLSDHLNTW